MTYLILKRLSLFHFFIYYELKKSLSYKQRDIRFKESQTDFSLENLIECYQHHKIATVFSAFTYCMEIFSMSIKEAIQRFSHIITTISSWHIIYNLNYKNIYFMFNLTLFTMIICRNFNKYNNTNLMSILNKNYPTPVSNWF